jgi:hypothetical protein
VHSRTDLTSLVKFIPTSGTSYFYFRPEGSEKKQFELFLAELLEKNRVRVILCSTSEGVRAGIVTAETATVYLVPQPNAQMYGEKNCLLGIAVPTSPKATNPIDAVISQLLAKASAKKPNNSK